MFSVITQLFSSPVQAEGKAAAHPRQVSLSGNIFHFAMPEDFSKDMPAHDMVESLDITDVSNFDNPEYGNLLRRWWDIKETGWFGRPLGTVMMDVSVQRVVENKATHIHTRPYDIRDRMDFVLMLNDRFHQRYDAINAEIEAESGPFNIYNAGFATVNRKALYATWREPVINQQKWIETNVAAPHGVLTVLLNLPLTDNAFIEVSFTYSKNDNILLTEFIDVASLKMDIIKNSMRVKYEPKSVFENIVSEEWLQRSNDEILNQHYGEIMKLFYGPNPEAAMLDMK